MARVTGIGGVFFKARDAEASRAWYRTHLGIDVQPWGALFRWRDGEQSGREGTTAWAIFPEDSTYFGPDGARLMINYRVDDLAAVIGELRAEGCSVEDKVEETE